MELVDVDAVEMIGCVLRGPKELVVRLAGS